MKQGSIFSPPPPKKKTKLLASPTYHYFPYLDPLTYFWPCLISFHCIFTSPLSFRNIFVYFFHISPQMELRLNQTARHLRLYSEESNFITRKTSKKKRLALSLQHAQKPLQFSQNCVISAAAG
jgi:hypothetical protein